MDYLRYEKGSSNTVAGYERSFKTIFEYAQEDVGKIDENKIYEYVEKIGERLKRNSVLRKISSIKTFYRFCYLNKMVEDPLNYAEKVCREKKATRNIDIKKVKE